MIIAARYFLEGTMVAVGILVVVIVIAEMIVRAKREVDGR